MHSHQIALLCGGINGKSFSECFASFSTIFFAHLKMQSVQLCLLPDIEAV